MALRGMLFGLGVWLDKGGERRSVWTREEEVSEPGGDEKGTAVKKSVRCLFLYICQGCCVARRVSECDDVIVGRGDVLLECFSLDKCYKA